MDTIQYSKIYFQLKQPKINNNNKSVHAEGLLATSASSLGAVLYKARKAMRSIREF